MTIDERRKIVSSTTAHRYEFEENDEEREKETDRKCCRWPTAYGYSPWDSDATDGQEMSTKE